MYKVAIVGANGQVGAELCLLLAAREEVSLVPICRNRSGSAFLRWQGIACRHGRIAEAADAPRLIGDCQMVINCSLATGSPADIRRTQDRIARNIFEYSTPTAKIVHFSTQSVYGDPMPGRWVRWRNPYGRAKLATERSVRRAARRTGKAAVILRLGHVCGALQEISNTIRTQIRNDAVVLPAEDCSSNTIYTIAIVDALMQIMRDHVKSGTYDLMNTPQWTWKEVYGYEAMRMTIDSPPRLAVAQPSTADFKARQLAASLGGNLARQQWIREIFAKLFAHVPDRMNAKGMAWWYRKRAAAEIAALATPLEAAEHLSWVENGKRFFPASNNTAALLQGMSGADDKCHRRTAWPPDL
jgi:dTDP-4-dehydrorhamnose reductase